MVAATRVIGTFIASIQPQIEGHIVKRTLAMFAVVLTTGISGSFDAFAGDNVFKEFGDDVSDLGKQIGKTGKEVGKQIGETGKQVGKDIAKGTKDIGKAFSGD